MYSMDYNELRKGRKEKGNFMIHSENIKKIGKMNAFYKGWSGW